LPQAQHNATSPTRKTFAFIGKNTTEKNNKFDRHNPKSLFNRVGNNLKTKKMKKVSLIFILLIGFGCISYAQTVIIGTQVWMTKNLNVSTFRNGEPIPQAKTGEEWEKAGQNKQPAWCYYENDLANGAKYGKLYNWYAVIDSRGLAPEGYHIPSDAEWTKLTDFLGGEKVVGTKMKSKSGWNSYTTGGSKTCQNCVNWNDEYRRKVPCHTCKDTRSIDAPEVTHSANGSNTSGFCGLPGGGRDFNGTLFGNIGYGGGWWSSTEDITSSAWVRFLSYDNVYVYRGSNNKQDGFSVRCLRD